MALLSDSRKKKRGKGEERREGNKIEDVSMSFLQPKGCAILTDTCGYLNIEILPWTYDGTSSTDTNFLFRTLFLIIRGLRASRRRARPQYFYRILLINYVIGQRALKGNEQPGERHSVSR